MAKDNQRSPQRKSQKDNDLETQRQKELKDVQEKGYGHALQLMFYEGQIAWQINVLFVGLNIGIGTIIQDKLDKITEADPVLLWMSITGILINYYWLGTFRRNNKYYHFRMAQARELEPDSWKLLRDRGYRFSHGAEIDIPIGSIPEVLGDRAHKLSTYEKRASNRRAIAVAIWLFGITFGLLFIEQLIRWGISLYQHFKACL